jgi:divalent metal cation (Fe/Co/Zn/Cd) transporter
MARYERFDDDAPAPKFTVVTRSDIPHDSEKNEKIDLFVPTNTSLSTEEERTTRHALITLNIISIVVSTVCGLITFFLAVEEQSASALGFAVDTILDVLAFLTIIWRFTSTHNQVQREIYVLRILAVLFFMSGFGVFIDSVIDIRHKIHPIPNHYLIVAVLIQTIIFFCLSFGKYTIAKKLQVISAYSDAFNTLISALMALSVAISIAIYNSNQSVWYFDPMVGVVISVTIMVYGVWMMLKSFRDV